MCFIQRHTNLKQSKKGGIEVKKFTKLLVAQATVSLLVAPIALTSPAIVQAVTTESMQESQDKVGNVSLKKVEQSESGTIIWSLSVEKNASENNRQLSFSIAEPTEVMDVFDQTNQSQKLQPDKNGVYHTGENNQQAQTMTIEIQTKQIPQQLDYTLKISPKVNEGEEQLLLNKKETYDFSFTATEETSSEEMNTTEETTTATESLPSESEETASETTSSAESATSSPSTETSESTKSTSRSATQRTAAPAVAARSGLARVALGTGSKTIPKGAIKLNGIFSTIVKSRGGNAGEIIVPHDTPSDNNGMPYDEIVLSGSQIAVGAWSNDNYRLDFSKSFKGRTYMNFGSTGADGFAFVMQNDPKKNQALTTANAESDGQNLGVYGGTCSTGKNIPADGPQQFAIKNSVAVEFDLNANYSSSWANKKDGPYYDSKQTDQNAKDGVNPKDAPHMAYTFPANLEKGYYSADNKGSWWYNSPLGLTSHGYAAAINHQGLKNLNGVNNDSWYEFSYNFDINTGLFSYYLSNPTNPNQQTEVTTIPISDLENELHLKENENKAYWGFTASNGDNSGTVKFIFTQVPVDLGATVSNDVATHGTSIVDKNDSSEYTDSLPSAEYGEEVTMKSNFAIEADAEDVYDVTKWESYLDPNLYDLSKGIKNIKVNNKEVSGVTGSVSEEGIVTVNFNPSSNVGIGQDSTFEYTATLKSKGSITKTYFNSQISARENTIGDIRSFQGEEVAYWVVPQPEHPTVLSWEKPNVVTEKTDTKDRAEVSDGYDLKFYWQDEDDGEILNFTINRNNPDAKKEFAQIVTTGSTEFNDYSWHIPADKIVPGKNEYTITMTRGDEVQTLKLTLNVTGKLSFDKAPDILSWTGRKASESKGTLARDSGNPMTLSVSDSREDTSTWALYVQAELTDTTAPFDFVFKKDAVSAEQSIMTDPVLVMRKGDVTPTNFTSSKTWNESAGVLLHSNNYMSVGDYSGKAVVKWNLYDTEVPE